MKQYVIDELRPNDHLKLMHYLKDNFESSELGGIYWVKLLPELLTQEQAAHAECQPFYFALELEPQRLSCELLVRTRTRIKCTCITYAAKNARDWLIDLVDDIFEQLEINV